MMHAISLTEVANLVAKLKMYPYFDIANYILMCSMVRDDSAQQSSGGSGTDTLAFSRKHPLSSWLSSMLLCFASVILTNLLLGESPIAPFTNHRDLLTASIVWYAVNYAPFDIFYKLCKILPVKVIIYSLKEVQRANKVQHGIHYALKAFPHSYVVMCVVGVLKGAGYYYMRIFERLIRGTWVPNSHEILHPTLATKACLLASIAFILDHEGYIDLPHNTLYLAVVAFFVLFRWCYLILNIHDPFHPFENIFCAIFFGGMVDALKKAITSTGDKTKTDENALQSKSQSSKPKEE
jgi:hypothetical protein